MDVMIESVILTFIHILIVVIAIWYHRKKIDEHIDKLDSHLELMGEHMNLIKYGNRNEWWNWNNSLRDLHKRYGIL